MKDWIKKLASFSPAKQEFINFSVSMLPPVILLLVLILGVDEKGDFRHGIFESVATFFTSTTSFYVATLIAIPMFLLLALKAHLLDVPRYDFFTWFSQGITGVFYSLGVSIMTVMACVTRYDISFNSSIFLLGFGLVVLGVGLFFIFQALIQRRSDPRL